MGDQAIFLDKDGTLLEDVPYNVEPRLMRLAEHAREALRLLAPHFRLVVVSNQSGVAHGYFAETALAAVERRLRQLLAEGGVELAGFYFCPHHPRGQVAAYRLDCECRKPQPGMLLKAARELDLDLDRSWMVGDILDDVEAGRRAGCRTVLIDNGGETEWVLSDQRQPHFSTDDLYAAAEWIVEHSSDDSGVSPLALANSAHLSAGTVPRVEAISPARLANIASTGASLALCRSEQSDASSATDTGATNE